MGDYKDCPLWQDATKAAEQWEKDYEEGKKDIEEALELALGVTGKTLTMLKPKIRSGTVRRTAEGTARGKGAAPASA